MKAIQSDSKVLHYAMSIVLILAILWTLWADFIPLFRVLKVVLAMLAVALLAASFGAKTGNRLFGFGAGVGALFYLLQFGVLFVYYFGLFILSPDSIQVFYVPGLIYIVTLCYWARASHRFQ